MKDISIHTEYIQLQQLIKLSGYALSGGTAKELIRAGGARVNGEICTMRGKKLRPGDVVTLGQEEYRVTGETPLAD